MVVPGFSHEHFRGALEIGVPQRLRVGAAVQQFDHFVGRLLPISRAQDGEHLGAGFIINEAGGPISADFVSERVVAPSGAVWLGIAFRRIPLLVLQQGIGEGPQHEPT